MDCSIVATYHGHMVTHSTVPKRYLSAKESARYCGLGLSTLNNLAWLNKGPKYIKVFGRKLFDRRDLDEWLQSMKVDPNLNRPQPPSSDFSRGTQTRPPGGR